MLSPRECKEIAEWAKERAFHPVFSLVPRYRGGKVAEILEKNPEYRKAFAVWKTNGVGVSTEIVSHEKVWDVVNDRPESNMTEKEFYTDTAIPKEKFYQYVKWAIAKLNKAGV